MSRPVLRARCLRTNVPNPESATFSPRATDCETVAMKASTTFATSVGATLVAAEMRSTSWDLFTTAAGWDGARPANYHATVVPLQVAPQTGDACTWATRRRRLPARLGTIEADPPTGPWGNGSPTDSGSVSPGSNPGGPAHRPTAARQRRVGSKPSSGSAA